jgi:uncharacterized protein
MKTVFADTSFYIAFVNPRDTGHRAVMDFVQRFSGKLVTTEYVLVEVGNWLARSGDRPIFLSLLKELQADPDTMVLAGDHSLFEAGLSLYSRRSYKNWSMTDCISFVVMRQRRLAEALTADHHFEQAGFKVLLK